MSLTVGVVFALCCPPIFIYHPLCRDPFDGKRALIYNAPEVLLRRTGPKKYALSGVEIFLSHLEGGDDGMTQGASECPCNHR